MKKEKPTFEIENNRYGFKCEIHGDTKKILSANNELHCPHCILQYILVNEISPNKSRYRDNEKYITWDIKECFCD
jgi:hypothetical protein